MHSPFTPCADANMNALDTAFCCILSGSETLGIIFLVANTDNYWSKEYLERGQT